LIDVAKEELDTNSIQFEALSVGIGGYRALPSVEMSSIYFSLLFRTSCLFGG